MHSKLIKPLTGLGDIIFEMSMQDVVLILREPDETEIVNNYPFPETTLYIYFEEGINLFFSSSNKILNIIETDHQDTILWNEKIFLMNEKSILNLFKLNGYNNPEIELHEWGEKRISFEDAGIDLFFEKGVLASVSLSKPDNIDNVQMR